MDTDENTLVEDRLVTRVKSTQVEHFAGSGSSCRALRLPDGVLLRYTLQPSLFFFLASENVDGYVVTRVFASDSPYERQKIKIGEVRTSMFDQPAAEPDHLRQVEVLLRTWVDFILDDSDPDQDFKVFGLKSRPG